MFYYIAQKTTQIFLDYYVVNLFFEYQKMGLMKCIQHWKKRDCIKIYVVIKPTIIGENIIRQFQ